MALGECNCGAVAFEIDTQLTDVFVCHCSICKKKIHRQQRNCGGRDRQQGVSMAAWQRANRFVEEARRRLAQLVLPRLRLFVTRCQRSFANICAGWTDLGRRGRPSDFSPHLGRFKGCLG